MRRSATASIARGLGVLIGLWSFVGARPVAAQEFELTENQFNQWLTNGRGSPVQLFETQLKGQLAQLDDTCNLTGDQLEKLELAGRGDIARFQTDVAQLHDELVGKTYNENDINKVYQQIQPLALRVRTGVLADGSLFEKVRMATLDDEQHAAYERVEMDRIRFQHRAKLRLFVASLDGMVPMLAEQREALLDLFMKTTRPPKRWSGHQYDWYYVLYHASRAPRADLERILDAAQLRRFDAVVLQAARFGDRLRALGLEPMDDAEQDNADGVAGVDGPVIQLGEQ